MLRSLLIAFRQQYPQGSLVSDLVCIHDGLYLVRAVAMVDSRTLATGLAAHSVIEAAEDTACARALSHIGVPTIGDAAPPSLAVPPPEASQPHPSPQPGLSQAPPSDPWSTAAADSQVTQHVEPLVVDSKSPFLDPTLASDASELGLTQSFNVPSITAGLPVDSERASTSPSLDADLLNLEGIPTPSIDLSDIIAQTDVELQRLGWNVNQGREFLEKTYGKRSRHDLTDEELLEFLLFLETQPTPGP